VNIQHEGHIERLTYGWWEPKRGNVLLPRTLGHKNNYVLTHEELAAYDIALVQLHEKVTKERERVAVTLTALRKGRVHRWDLDPTCFTIAHILEFMITVGRAKLAVMQLLHYVTTQRKPHGSHEQGSASQAG
jgi:hypothetical protein